MRTPSNYISKIIDKHTGMQIKEFCKLHLGCSYASFHSRWKKGKVHLIDYFIISEISGVSLHDLFYNDSKYSGLIERAKNEAFEIPRPAPKEKSKPLVKEGFTLIDV